jgi:hypothetical protein
MIGRLRLAARLLSFAAASWILLLMLWGLITGARHIAIPQVALWLFVAGIISQLGLWLVSKAVRRK